MHLHTDVIHMRHITDLFCFGDTAGVAYIRLDDGKAPVFEERSEAPAAEYALAAGEGNVRLARNSAEQIRVQRLGRLFIVKYSERLQFLCKLHRGVCIGIGVQLYYDIKAVSALLTYRGNTLDRCLQFLVCQYPSCVPVLKPTAPAPEQRVNLYAVKACFHCVPCCDSVILRGQHGFALAAPVELYLACIRAQPAVCLAAEQLIYRHAQCLSLYVPNRNVYRAHPGENYRSAAHAPEGLSMHLIPYGFVVHRVHAEDDLRHVSAHPKSGIRADAV